MSEFPTLLEFPTLPIVGPAHLDRETGTFNHWMWLGPRDQCGEAVANGKSSLPRLDLMLPRVLL